MSSNQQNGGGTTIYVLGSLAEGVFGLAFTMLLVRLISQEDFGAWRQFMVLGNIVWNVAIFGLPRSLTYFFSIANAEDQGAIARRTLWLTLGIGAAASILFYFGLDFAAARFDNPGLVREAPLFSTILALHFPNFIVFSLLVAANRRALSAVLRLVLGTLRLGALFGLFWLDASLHTFLVGMVIFGAVQFCVVVGVYLRVCGPARVPLWRNSWGQLRYSSDVAVQSLSGQLALETDKLLVSAAYTPERFASYSVGARELPLIPSLPFSISDSISPDLTRMAAAQQFAEFRELWHKWIRRTAVLMFPVFALVLYQYKEIVTILYTAEYIEGALPMLIFACLIPLRVTSYYQIMLNLNGSRIIMYASIAMLALIASLSWLFLKLFGLWGPALGVLIAEYVVNGVVLSKIAKRTQMTLATVLPWSFLGKLLVTAVASGALALPVIGLAESLGLFWRVAAYGLTLMVLYGAAVLSLSMIDPEDIALVRSYMRR